MSMPDHTDDPVAAAGGKVASYLSLATVAAEAIAQLAAARARERAATDERTAAALRAQRQTAYSQARLGWAPILDPKLRERTGVLDAGLVWAKAQAWRPDPAAATGSSVWSGMLIHRSVRRGGALPEPPAPGSGRRPRLIRRSRPAGPGSRRAAARGRVRPRPTTPRVRARRAAAGRRCAGRRCTARTARRCPAAWPAGGRGSRGTRPRCRAARRGGRPPRPATAPPTG